MNRRREERKRGREEMVKLGSHSNAINCLIVKGLYSGSLGEIYLISIFMTEDAILNLSHSLVYLMPLLIHPTFC